MRCGYEGGCAGQTQIHTRFQFSPEPVSIAHENHRRRTLKRYSSIKSWRWRRLECEEGCVDLDPLYCPQAAESDGTGKPETTGTTCTCSVDSYVTGEGGGERHTAILDTSLLSGACLTVTFCRIAGLGRGVRSTECRTKYVHIPVLFFSLFPRNLVNHLTVGPVVHLAEKVSPHSAALSPHPCK